MSPVTPAEARAALQRFIDGHFAKDGKTHARFTIPPRDDDDDMLLTRFIAESEATAAKLAEIRDVSPATAELLDLRARLQLIENQHRSALDVLRTIIEGGHGLSFAEALIEGAKFLGLTSHTVTPRQTLDLTELRTTLHAARASAHQGATVQSLRYAFDHVDAAVERLAGKR